MSKTVLAGLLLLGTGIVGTGCAYTTAAESVQGRAWVMKNTPFGSSFWHCDASAGEPTCTQVTNTATPAASASAAPASGGGAK